MKRYINYFLIIIASTILFYSIDTLLRYLLETSPKSLEMYIEATVQKPDEWQLFYRGEEEKFNEINSSRMPVAGKVKEKIVFSVPLTNSISHLRLDLGNNSNQLPIKIHKIFLKSKFGIIHLNHQEDFRTNKYVQYDSKKDKLITRSLSGRYDPYIVGNLTNEIQELSQVYTPKYISLFSALLTVVIIVYLSINWNQRLVKRNVSTVIFIVITMGMLVLPIGYMIFGDKKMKNEKEKRELAKMPRLGEENFHLKFESYFNDNFGFRNEMIEIGTYIKANSFRSTTDPDRVILGKNDFLFYNNEDVRLSYSNSNLLTIEELENTTIKWEKRTKYLSNNNISYYIGFWPNKHSIYPENLPLVMRIQIKDTLSLAKQINNHLKETKSKIKFIDVSTELITSKDPDLLYYKLDTHWNDLGAFIGYQSFINIISQEENIKALKLEEFNISWIKRFKGDLLNMLGVASDSSFFDIEPILKHKNPSFKFLYKKSKGFPKRTIITIHETAPNDKTVVFFRDSFTTALIPYFSLTFKKVIYIRRHYDQRIIDKVKPDIVIDAFVERSIPRMVITP